MENLTSEQLLAGAAVLLFIFGVFNTIMTAWKNKKEYTQERDKPFDELKERVKTLERSYEDAERRIQRLEENSKDLQTGLMTLCEGVQALLNHSLMDGNEEEMRGAAGSISKWLRGR